MNKNIEGRTEQWLNVSAHILTEKPDRLQHCILEIYKNKPELGCYATELAQLRMIGPLMENNLLQIWNAKTVDSIDRIIRQNCHDQPADRALLFLAKLVKWKIEPMQTTH
ncbi:MAG TPA: hypothetical protein ENK96_01700 [Desulfobulbaceae bacterium]|nr:hypothetical protein [Desulfobulbaceae bacterium]